MMNGILNPIRALAQMWERRDLLRQMTVRDTRSRYRGTAIGLFWSVLQPLIMLAVYAFFFGQVFEPKWSSTSSDPSEFALILFIGLVLHGFLAEILNRAPTLIVSNVNLVKRVVFPLDTLPVMAVCTALVHLMISLAIWLAFHWIVRGPPPMTAWLLPVGILPLFVFALGAGWLLASLGVYLRDMSYVMPMISMVLMFVSPVFYPASALRPPYDKLVLLSPLTEPIEFARDVLIGGQQPRWDAYFGFLGCALIFAWLAYAWFLGTKKGFADVL